MKDIDDYGEGCWLGPLLVAAMVMVGGGVTLLYRLFEWLS